MINKLVKNKDFRTLFLIPCVVFFIFALITLPRYGVNWDIVNHLPRGQAYLHFFLTGQKDYSSEQKFFDGWQTKGQWYWQKPESLKINSDKEIKDIPSRSMYQLRGYEFTDIIDRDGGGHPPLSDILSSLFNRILFGELRVVNDIDSYRVYSVLLASLLVGLVCFWVSKSYGLISGIIASISLALYPLFWSESHFNNEKDIPETVYWSFMLYTIWHGVTSRKPRWLILSGILLGFALGTKFNILFSVFVVVPWLCVYMFPRFAGKTERFMDLAKENFRLLVFGLLAVALGVLIFILSWPYLWSDPIANIAGVFKFYKDIGTTNSIDPRFVGPLGTTTFPISWILYTTPIATLVLFGVGLLVSIRQVLKEKNKLVALFLLWLAIPVLRVTWGGATTYGGVRQIMEFIPALAIFAGIGGGALYNFLKGFKVPMLRPLFVATITIFILLPVVSTHPNENVYFNSLIGGLSGAKKANFPFWGFSFGSPYRQLAVWLNNNVEIGANIAYTYDLIPNLPRIWLREDVNLANANRSGYLRAGEYAIGLTYQGTDNRSYYDSYLEKYIEPVHEVKVDGVAIAKIWKNDSQHLKGAWVESNVLNPVVKVVGNSNILVDIGETKMLSRLEIDYQDKSCKLVTSGYSRISIDGKTWVNLPGSIPDDWGIPVLGVQPKNGKFIEPFVGQTARFIGLELGPEGNCLTNIQKVRVYYFGQ